MSDAKMREFQNVVWDERAATLWSILRVDHATRAAYAHSWGLAPAAYTAIVWDACVRQGFATVTEGPCPT